MWTCLGQINMPGSEGEVGKNSSSSLGSSHFILVVRNTAAYMIDFLDRK